MTPMNRITEEQEAEFRVMTANMFKHGGTWNVLQCVSTMQKVQIIILQKLNELLKEQNNASEGD